MCEHVCTRRKYRKILTNLITDGENIVVVLCFIVIILLLLVVIHSV